MCLETIGDNHAAESAKHGQEQGGNARCRPRANRLRPGRTANRPWALEQMDAAGPSPAEAAVLNEALERRLEALADPGAAPDRAVAAGGLHQSRDR